ncbi:MAG: hypothetical protein IPJ41_12530 [Phycisphaerales bacterium]|nr:hypothetical protein [Phycisphaerales bacterium]
MTTDHAQPTLVRLAATTPARDWARLRLTGRLDWRAAIAEAGLPEPLADLVSRVVGRSRLWRSEKVDLAREMMAHFADGLHAGRTPEQLTADFGDPRRAGRLMGRAKRRGRHWAHRAFAHTIHGIGAVFLACALVYALLVWRYYTGEPRITRNFTAEYNSKIEQIPEADRAWGLYVESYNEAEPLPKPLEAAWPALAPEHPLYNDALAYLEREQGVISLLHRAAAKPHLGAPLSDTIDPRMRQATEHRTGPTDAPWPEPAANPMLVTVLLPELGHFRGMAKLLTFDAHVAARAGQAERAGRDIDTMIGIADHAAERPFLISGLVGFAIEALAIQTTSEIVHEFPDLLSDQQLQTLAHRHAAFMGGRPHADMTGERWFFEDVIQRIYTDDGKGNGHITAQGMHELLDLTGPSGGSELEVLPNPLAPITAAVIADRASMTAMHERLMARAEANTAGPMWEYDKREEANQQLDAMLADPIARVRYMPVALLMPALDKVSRTVESMAQRRDGVLTGLALELYRRDHGGYPPTLETLVPRYLPEVPPDRFTGEPLHYRLIDGQPRLWSVGADRNDDGGVAAAESRGDEMRWAPRETARQNELATPQRYDGDWVLWPIVYEPLTRDPRDEP